MRWTPVRARFVVFQPVLHSNEDVLPTGRASSVLCCETSTHHTFGKPSTRWRLLRAYRTTRGTCLSGPVQLVLQINI
jgi:hypothetical protein